MGSSLNRMMSRRGAKNAEIRSVNYGTSRFTSGLRDHKVFHSDGFGVCDSASLRVKQSGWGWGFRSDFSQRSPPIAPAKSVLHAMLPKLNNLIRDEFDDTCGNVGRWTVRGHRR
jgi:hypothetical protein